VSCEAFDVQQSVVDASPEKEPPWLSFRRGGTVQPLSLSKKKTQEELQENRGASCSDKDSCLCDEILRKKGKEKKKKICRQQVEHMEPRIGDKRGIKRESNASTKKRNSIERLPAHEHVCSYKQSSDTKFFVW
jgi:hypothetical protein